MLHKDGRLLFDVTGQLQWYAHHVHASGIQRVTEHIIRSAPIRTFPNLEFVFRPLGDHRFHRIDPSAIFDLADERRKDRAISRLRWILVRASRSPALSGLVTEARSFDGGYILKGWGRLDKVAPLWTGMDDRSFRFSPIQPPTEADTLVNTGDFWCHPQYARTVVTLKRRTGMRIVVILHDLFYLDNPDWNHSRFGHFTRQLAELAPHVDVWMPTSRFVESQLKSYLGDQATAGPSMHPLPMGWGLSQHSSTPTSSEIKETLERFGLEPQQYFLSVGKIEPRRNMVALIDAFSAVCRREKRPLPRCVIVGQDGWKSGAFKSRLRSLGHEDGQVTWLKNVSDAELSVLYAAARLCVVPSIVEGWGLPIRESIAHGTPCLASNGGGAMEAGGGLVDYFDPHQPDGLMSALHQWLIDDERPRKARDVLARFREDLSPASWDASGRAVLDAAFDPSADPKIPR